MCGFDPIALLPVFGTIGVVVVTDIVIVTQTVKALSKRGSWIATIPIIGLCIALGCCWNSENSVPWLAVWWLIFAIPPIRLCFLIRDACRKGSPVRSRRGIAQGIWLLLVSGICEIAMFHLHAW